MLLPHFLDYYNTPNLAFCILILDVVVLGLIITSSTISATAMPFLYRVMLVDVENS